MNPRRSDQDDPRDPFAALERHLNDMIGRYLFGALRAGDGETRVFGYRTETGPDGLRIEAFGDPESVRAARAEPGGPGRPAGDEPIWPGQFEPEFQRRAETPAPTGQEAAPAARDAWHAPTRVEVRDGDGAVEVVVEVPGVPAVAIEAEAVRDRLAITAVGDGIRYRDEIHLSEVDPDSLVVSPEDGRLVARLTRA